jgi:hypothetical protein
MKLTFAQHDILHRLVRQISTTPEFAQLEVIQVSLRTSYGLYQQERNLNGMAMYRPLVEFVELALTMKEIVDALSIDC